MLFSYVGVYISLMGSKSFRAHKNNMFSFLVLLY